MRTLPKSVRLGIAAAGLAISGWAATASAADPTAPSFASNYQLVWCQNFADMTSDSQIGVNGGGTLNSGSTWISHYPSGDNADFINPQGHDIPFGIDGSGAGNNYLTIRTQQGDTSNDYTGNYSEGALSSMDTNGNGFAQEYGYFEVDMWVPHVTDATNNDDPNTWPAFWLLSYKNGTEIDATESYGNYGAGLDQSPAGNPNISLMTVHDWSKGTGTSSSVDEPDMTSGFHLFGVDVEPSGINFYYDRQEVWSTPFIADAATPFYVLVDNALGGGNYNNADGTAYNWNLTANPSDLDVRYVGVWASPSSPNFVPIPEPSSLGVLLVGLPLLALRRRRGERDVIIDRLAVK
jgi:hypothetical protein